ncbi:tetratricopeptide repeat protein [Azospirillum sp.]|uniref:tetratricopeptide repeat protein n=1 Tax=Azospirillum sp. TaxID=34012 RepID=UPI003D7645EE
MSAPQHAAPAPDCTDPAAWTAHAEALLELGRPEEAVAAAARARDLRPTADAWAALALACLAANRTDDAAEAAAGALAIDGGHAPSLRVLALASLRRQRIAEAETFALAALRADGTYPEGLAALALVRMVQGDLGQADALLARATAAKPTMAEAFANRAAVLARLGRDDDAAAAAARALELKPVLAPPRHLLATLHRRAGRLPDAANCFAQVLATDPDHPDAAVNLADTLRLLGQTARSAAVCRAALVRRPAHAGLLGNLGAALHHMDDAAAAETAYRRALATAPALPEIENNLGRLLHRTGRLAPALRHLRRAAAALPQDGQVAVNLAAALLDAGQAEEAGQVVAAAVQANPRAVDALVVLGRALLALGWTPKAEAAFREAVAAAAADAPAVRLQAASLLVRAGERSGALPFLRPCLHDGSAGSHGWPLFGEALRGLRQVPDDGLFAADLLTAFAHPAVEKSNLLDAAIAVIDRLPAMARLTAALATQDPDAVVAALIREGLLDPMAADPVLHALLEWVVVADSALERALTVLRRALLAEAAGEGPGLADRAPWDGFAAALARQCFLNEYAWAETAGEAQLAERLGRALHDALAAGQTLPAGRIAVYACYRPLAAWEGADAAAERSWPPAMAGLVEALIAEPRAQAAIARDIPRLTAVDDAVSTAVRQQYEENQYPRWRHAGLIEQARPVPRVIGAILPHVALDPADWAAPEILIAGCGTGRESVWAANHFAGARILAVDLSRASLSYARRQTDRLGIAGITYAQADLLRLHELGRSFDLIQSVGVLHHTGDPLGAWRRLAGLLRPHGLMKIGLYSEIARGAVLAARALAEEHGVTASPSGIRRLRGVIAGLPDGHPARGLLQSVDFYSTSAFRDLVLHVQEHRMTLPQIAGWIDELGLEFLGFQFDDPAVAHLYRRRFPEDPTMTRLDLWHLFEIERPFTFGGLYQLWLRRRN